MKYKLISEKYIDEVGTNVKYLKHIKTGARILLIPNEDENKSFLIGFRTPVYNDKGTPHIIEHSVLCGSKKYPVKDPFVELLKGSLNNFLNAMTYSDKTIYPFSTTNEKDYDNLMSIYMDAVMMPNVNEQEEIFKQEGWHYELNSLEDDIQYNGVVYNEMKGTYSDPSRHLYDTLNKVVFPNSTYGCNSGGNPNDIPSLTYQEFLDYKDKYYHPSNSYIILYGNLDMDAKLKFIDEEYFSKYDYKEIQSHILPQSPNLDIKEASAYYPLDEQEEIENKTMYAFVSVLKDYQEPLEIFALDIIMYELFQKNGATIKQSILDQGFAQKVSGFIETGIMQPNINITVQNAKDNCLDTFKQIIKDEALKVIKEGIDKTSLLATINYYEFLSREATSTYPLGIYLSCNALTTWLYDEDNPYLMLQYNEIFKQLKEKVNSTYYEELIKKYFLENEHYGYATLIPSKTLLKEQDEKLKKQLKEYKESLSKEQLLKLIEDTKKLKQYQSTPSPKEQLITIPHLKLKDLKREIVKIPNDIYIIDGLKVLNVPLNTRKITYTYFDFDIKNIDNELMPYVGILDLLLRQVNTEEHSYIDLNNEIKLKVGSIGTEIKFNQTKNSGHYSVFRVMGKSFDENINEVFRLVKEIITKSLFDDYKHIYDIFQSTVVSLKNSLVNSGHITSVVRSLSYLHKAYAMEEQATGLDFYYFLNDLVQHFEEKKSTLKDNLEQLTHIIFRKENLQISSIGKKVDDNDVINFANSLFTNQIEEKEYTFTRNEKNEGLGSTSLVQYVTRAGLFDDKYQYTGALKVFLKALSYDYLWPQIRVLGGAYGAFGEINRTGSFILTSYRDPNLDQTNETYNKIIDFIDNFNPTKEELTNYIIGTIGELDAVITNKQKGMYKLANYQLGFDDEDLQRERNQVLDCTVEDIKALKPLVAYVLNQNVVCAVGNDIKIKESKLFKTTYNIFEQNK